MKIMVRAQATGVIAAVIVLLLTGCGQSEPTSGPSATSTSEGSAAAATASAAAATSTTVDQASTPNETLADNSRQTSTSSTLVSASVPATAEETSVVLSQIEQAIRADDGRYSSAELADLGRYQQLLYRHLSFNPDWVETVLAAVADDVAPAVASNWEARENLQALLATHTIHDTLPAWRVVEPFPAPELLSYYKEAEAKTGIDWEYVAAINLVETRMGRIRGVSTAGAVGPMQFLPTTWAECCEGDPTNPRDAIVGAATYLTHRGGPENMDKAIWGYNNSEYYVNAVKAYADVLRADERAYYGYHAWQVYFLTTAGVILIGEGYEQETEIPIAEWLARYPDTLISPSR